MAQTLKNLQNIAEFDLFPVFNNQIGYAPSPFIEKIQKVTLKDPGISANTPVGANGGVGYGSESAAIPESGAQMYERFKIAPVDLYGNLEISDKALTLGSGDSSINLMIDQVEGIKNTMSFMMGRSIIAGNGSGVICTVSASDGAKKEFTVSDTRGLVEGMKIDFYANSGTTPAHAKKRIASIDRNANKITVEGDAFTAAAGFITYQGSYKNEILGIEAFFDDTVTSIYGVDKANKSWIKPEVDELASGDIDAKLRSMVRNSERYKDGKIDMMLAGDEAYEVYLNYLKESKLMPVERQHFQGGVSAIEVLFGNRKIAFVNERHVAPNAIVGVDTSSFLLPMTPVGFLKHTDGSAFKLKDNSSIWQAVIGTYLNLICKKPGAQFKLTGVNLA